MNIIENINKFGLIAVLCLVLLNTCNTCNIRRDLSAVSDRSDSLQGQLNKMYNKDEFNMQIEIQSLEIERSTLFNMNNIVLTKSRPDVRINEINEKLKTLHK